MLVFPCGISEHGRNLWVWMVWQVEDSILIPRPWDLSILQDVELLAPRMLFELVKGQQVMAGILYNAFPFHVGFKTFFCFIVPLPEILGPFSYP